MNSQNMTIAILATLSAISLALADDFKTMDGKEYKDAKVTRVEPDGIIVRTKSGISKLYFAELPEDVQRRFNFDPQQARAYSAEQAAAYSAMQKEAPATQPEAAAPQNQQDFNQQQPAANSGAAVQQPRRTPAPYRRYTTVLHELPVTQAPRSTAPPPAPKSPPAAPHPPKPPPPKKSEGKKSHANK